jgi:hypothetical protein
LWFKVATFGGFGDGYVPKVMPHELGKIYPLADVEALLSCDPDEIARQYVLPLRQIGAEKCWRLAA